jgi:hypothetical protein
VRSLFDAVFHRPQMQAINGYFSTFTAYAPSFTTWQGGLYEAELTRSIIESGADHASKLKPDVSGSAQPVASRALAQQPNPWMTTPQFIKRVWTMLQVNDTALIVPMLSDDGATITGYYPILPGQCTAYDVDGALWLMLTFPTGDETLVEWSRVGVMTRHQYRSDLFGDGTNVLQPTLELMHAQNEAEQAAIKQGAAIRFIGKLSQNRNDGDRDKARKEFNAQLSADNAGGIAVYDKIFSDVEQVTPQSYTVDAAQMERIEKSAYRFFGSNEDIVMNKADEDTFNSFYEGRIEPFAVQLGFVVTSMTYTANEIAHGNSVMFSANRLEFASNTTKLNVAVALFDRGIWNGNQVADVFQSAHYEGGERHVIRGEYIDLALISEHTSEQAAQAAQTNANIAAIDASSGAGDGKKEVDDASKTK